MWAPSSYQVEEVGLVCVGNDADTKLDQNMEWIFLSVQHIQ